jgi:hypothetical protein
VIFIVVCPVRGIEQFACKNDGRPIKMESVFLRPLIAVNFGLGGYKEQNKLDLYEFFVKNRFNFKEIVKIFKIYCNHSKFVI